MKQKIWKIAKSVLIWVVVIAGSVLVGGFLGGKIYEARYFKSLEKFEFVVLEENPVCPIHEAAPSNAPIVVNLNEGNAAPLKLYDTYPTYTLQIREKDEYGVMWMVGGDGWNGFAFPDNHYIDFSIKRDKMFQYSGEAARLFFCQDCMKMIYDLDPKSNFIIVDGYDKDNIKFYDLAEMDDEDGLDVRHYHFTLDEKGTANCSITMTSSYFDGGKELDHLNKDVDELEKAIAHERDNLTKP